MRKFQYLVRINKDPSSDWGASVLDLPGCVATGKSIDITLRRIEKAIALHFEVCAKMDKTAITQTSFRYSKAYTAGSGFLRNGGSCCLTCRFQTDR